MTKLIPTRADGALATGMTPKKLAAQTKRHTAQIKASIEKLAMPWADVDNSVEGAQAELLAAFEKFERHIDSAVEYLLESAE